MPKPRQPALEERLCPFCEQPVEPGDTEALHGERVSSHDVCRNLAARVGRAYMTREQWATVLQEAMV